MKTRLLFSLLGAALLAAPVFAPPALAQSELTTDDYKKSWVGVAALKTIEKKEKTREMLAAYPVFLRARPVAQVAQTFLKNDAVRSFNDFEKESRGTAKDLGLSDGMKYSFELTPTLELNRPRLLSITMMVAQFTGGAHGIYGTSGYVFGFPRGATKPRVLKLADFFANDNGARKRVNELLMAKLRATKGKEQEATWTLDDTVKAVTNDQMENFIAQSDGLKWFFGPYAMGPYAVGEFEVKLSARELGPTFRAGMLRG